MAEEIKKVEETKKAKKVNFFQDKSKEQHISWVDKQVGEHPVVKTKGEFRP
ncbi:unnamed protein product, partial [marine sediment metagenome]